mgnify:CR=1 FL=1
MSFEVRTDGIRVLLDGQIVGVLSSFEPTPNRANVRIHTLDIPEGGLFVPGRGTFTATLKRVLHYEQNEKLVPELSPEPEPRNRREHREAGRAAARKRSKRERRRGA